LMKLVVIGGHSRNIGKTSLAASLIAATPGIAWTAAKLTLFGHGICSADGEPCDCAVESPDHPFVVTAERDREGSSDTARLLRAGAKQVFWLRAPQDRLGEALPTLLERLERAPYVLLESNSVLDFLDPDVYVPLMDHGTTDFKASALRLSSRASAFAVVGSGEASRSWPGFDVELLQSRPWFAVAPPAYCSPDLVKFVRARLAA
jgi:hypothetical protein